MFDLPIKKLCIKAKRSSNENLFFVNQLVASKLNNLSFLCLTSQPNNFNMRFLVIAAVTIMCFGFIVEAGHIPYIPDKLLGKLAPPLLFLGGAYGTAAVGAVIGAGLAKKSRHGGHGGMGGMHFAVHPGLQYGHVAPLDHQI